MATSADAGAQDGDGLVLGSGLSVPPDTDAPTLHSMLRRDEAMMAKLEVANPAMAAAAKEDDPAVLQGALMLARYAQAKVAEAEVKAALGADDAAARGDDDDVGRRPRRKHSFSMAHSEHAILDKDEAAGVKHIFHAVHSHSMRKPVLREQKAYFGVEGTNYARPDSEPADEVLRAITKSHKTVTDLSPKVIIVLLGLGVSILANATLALSALVENWKIGVVANLLKSDGDAGWGAAFGVWTGFGVVCALIGCSLVLVSPAVRSSGIPHVLAFLNGAVMPPVVNRFGKLVGPFDVTTLLAKMASTVMTVASGLFLGPEGPLIHMGGIFGAQIVRWLQSLTGQRANRILSTITAGRVKPHTERWFPVDMEQRRDFVAIGAGAAISGAFSAPLAGVLFVVEEAASKITIQLLELSFLACASSFFFTWSIKDSTFIGEGHVKFGKPASSFCSLYNWTHGFSFLVLSVTGGLVGAGFNAVVVRLNKWRQHAVNPFPARQVIEVLIVVLVSCAAAAGIPALWSCTASKPQLMMEGGVGCLAEEHWTQLSPALASHSDAVKFYGGGRGAGGTTPALAPHEVQWLRDNVDADDTAKLIYLARNMTSVPHVTFAEAHAGACGTGSFNEMATLFLKGGVKAVTMLLTRGTPHIFTPGALALFFVVYTSLAAYTAGITLASGLFVPHLLIGGAMGRLLGLLNLWIVTQACVKVPEGVDPAEMSVLEWTLSGYRESLVSCVAPDPGTFAMVGAAAVMAGSGRITVFLAVVMLELTGDLQFLPVIAASTVIAMWVGNSINHGLYHSLIPLLGVPFLDPEPHPAQAAQPIRRVMAAPVVALRETMTLPQLEAVLKGFDWLNAEAESTDEDDGSEEADDAGGEGGRAARAAASRKFDPDVRRHHAFPVVTADDHLVGIVERDLVQHIVTTMLMGRKERRRRRRRMSQRGALGTSVVRAATSAGSVASDGDGDVHALQAAVDLDALDTADPASIAATGTTIDLRRVMQRAPFVVYAQTSIARAYDMFRSLGLRHLCVVERDGRLVGIVTRKDLMTWRLEHELHKSLEDWAAAETPVPDGAADAVTAGPGASASVAAAGNGGGKHGSSSRWAVAPEHAEDVKRA